MKKKSLIAILVWTAIIFTGMMVGITVLVEEALGDWRPINPGIGPNTVELIPYQASEYHYQVIGLNETPPAGFEQPNFDDTTWSIGKAAFAAENYGCSLQSTVNTFWSGNSRLLIRRIVSIPTGATGVRVMVSIDNDIVGVFFNGAPISGFVSHEYCPILDEFRFDVPQNLVQPGPNLVVFHVLDRGYYGFFDTRILAEKPELKAPIDIIEELNQSLTLVPPQAPAGVSAKINSVIKKLEDYLQFLNQGKYCDALDKLDGAITQIQNTTDQVNDQKCSVKKCPGPNCCIPDDDANALIQVLESAKQALIAERDLLLADHPEC